MPRGPAPAENPQRRNHKGDRKDVAHDARAIDAPELPDAETYTSRTRTWYATWAASPQSSEFTSTEWMRLHMLAPLVEAFHTTEDAGLRLRLMAEIRLNEAKLGATLEDRVRLRMKIERPPGDDAPDPDAPAPSRARRDPRKKA